MLLRLLFQGLTARGMEGFAPRLRPAALALAMAIAIIIIIIIIIITALLLVDLGLGGVEATVLTHPADSEALRQMKAAIDPATIRATSCLGTWDFAVDPCASAASGVYFTCGIECSSDHGEGEESPSSASASSSSSASSSAAAAAAAARPVYRRVRGLILDSAGYGGELSAYVGNLSELRILQLSGNAIGGRIPAAAISSLTRLERLDLSANRFSGPIPGAIFGRLAGLRSLDLSHNGLQGELPRSLARLASLAELSLQGNALAGAVPDLTGSAGLRRLDLSGNRLSGELPMRRLPGSVSAVSLRNNSFSGGLRLPPRLARLAALDLSHNRLGGLVSGAVLAHPSLQQLNLSGNMLIGFRIRAHPRGILPGSPLVALDLSYNLVSGRLPAGLARMRQLSALSLRHNLLRGAIPRSYGAKAAAAAKPLSRLLLDGNYLVGPLPPQLVAASAQLPIVASLADNCFARCPFALCQGKAQKAQALCRRFNPTL